MGSTFRKGSEQTGQSGGMSHEQAALANLMGDRSGQLWRQTGPLRKETFGQLSSFLNGGTPSFLVGPTENASAQIAQLGRQMQESGVRGGQLRQNMSMLPMQRMGMIDQLRSGAFDTALNTGMGGATAAFGGMNGAMGGYGNAAGNLNSLGQQRQNQNYQFQQGLGSLAKNGMQAGGALMCWIAERLYGRGAQRTMLLRFWLTMYRPSWWVTKLYRTVGQWVSRQAWCPLLRPLFDHLIVMAERECAGFLSQKVRT